MAVPKKRVSRAVRNQRRSHDHLHANAALEACPSCGATKERHRVCPACGTYRGKQVFSNVDVDVAGSDAPPPTE